MAEFLVEDGTGVPDATSYASVEEADAYLGNNWADTEEAKQQFLMQGSDYADLRWGSQLKSYPLNQDQGLEFPRATLKDRYNRLVEGVPADWKKAVMLYAQSAKAGKLYPKAPGQDPREIKKKKVTVGPVTTETEYTGNTPADAFVTFPIADQYASQYCSSGSSINGKTMRN